MFSIVIVVLLILFVSKNFTHDWRRPVFQRLFEHTVHCHHSSTVPMVRGGFRTSKEALLTLSLVVSRTPRKSTQLISTCLTLWAECKQPTWSFVWSYYCTWVFEKMGSDFDGSRRWTKSISDDFLGAWNFHFTSFHFLAPFWEGRIPMESMFGTCLSGWLIQVHGSAVRSSLPMLIWRPASASGKSSGC